MNFRNLSQYFKVPILMNGGGEIEDDEREDDEEMVEGIADILSQVRNRENRSKIAKNMIGDFKRENVKYDLNKFLSMSKLMKKGGQMIKRADGSYSKRGLWDNIRANRGSGKKPTPEMLEQERKIRRESKEIGGIFMGQKRLRPLQGGGGIPEDFQGYVNMVRNTLGNLPIYSPDARYPAYQSNILDWNNNLNKLKLSVNPELVRNFAGNSPAMYVPYNENIPSPLAIYPYQGNVVLSNEGYDDINNMSAVLPHEITHGAFDNRNFIPQWLADNLYRTARNPEGFEQGDHKDLMTERAVSLMQVRNDIIRKYNLKQDSQIPRNIFNDYMKGYMNQYIKNNKTTETNDLIEALQSTGDATQLFNLLNMQVIPEKKFQGGGPIGQGELSEIDKEIFDKTKTSVFDWYKGRANNSNTRISGEANQVLGKLNTIPDISENVKYVPFTQMMADGNLANFEPKTGNVNLTNPFTSFEEQIEETPSDMFFPRSLKENLYNKKNEGIKSEFQDYYKSTNLSYPRGHEGMHYYIEPAMETVDKYKKEIASGYVPITDFVNTSKERAAEFFKNKPTLSEKINFRGISQQGYKNTTGLEDPTAIRNIAMGKPLTDKQLSGMQNREMYRTLMDVRTTFGIDPTVNENTDKFKSIYDEINKRYRDARNTNDQNNILKYRHMLDLFDSYGNDFEQLNRLNNQLVRGESTPINTGFRQFAELGGNINPSALSSSITITTTVPRSTSGTGAATGRALGMAAPISLWPVTVPVGSWIGSLFDDDEQPPKQNTEQKVVQVTPYQQLANLYNTKFLDFKNQYTKNNTSFITKNPTYIDLTSGRFNTAHIPNYTIDAIISAAQKQNYPIGKALTLVGRESTFGVGAKLNQFRSGDLRLLTSSWNPVKEYGYEPYNLLRFYADNKVPGIETVKSAFGWDYAVSDQKALENYVNSHPELINKYTSILNKTKPIGNLTALDFAIMKLAKDGVRGYNPGKKAAEYEQMFNSDYLLLKNDKNLANYLKSKGVVFKQGGKIMPKNFFKPRNSSIFATGGLTFRQAYDFLYGDEDNTQAVSTNSAPSQSEIDNLKTQNEELSRVNRNLNRDMSSLRNRNLAFNVINNPSYGSSENIEGSTAGSPTGSGMPGSTGIIIPNTKQQGSGWNMTGNVPQWTFGPNGKIEESTYNPNLPSGNTGDHGAFFDPNISYTVTSEFGRRKRPKKGASTNHQALDIATDWGNSVYSPLDGEVTKVLTDSGKGKQVEIKLDNGTTILLAHLSKQEVKPGQKVKRGELVGKIGSTGVSTGPHLHLEVWEKGKRVNPRNYFNFKK